jgi:brp/blh family beta-carotene 15,15'-monooxygenase
VLSFFTAFIFWIGTIFLNITTMLFMIIPNSLRENELYTLIVKYSNGYKTMIDSFEGYSRVAAPFIQTLGFSYFLNLFVPLRYQSVDIPIYKKIFRIFIKVIYLILPIFFFLIFSKVDKDSYTVIAGIGLLIIWFSKPKNIISLLDRRIIISDEDVKPEVINGIKILQLFLTLIEISWGISVYFFANYSATERLFITLGILSIGLVLLIIWQKYIKAHQTQWLENTLKKESAQKILDNIQTDKTEGEKQQ